jgi:hypothetical protein
VDRDQARQAARWFSYARIGLGVAAIVAPTLPARPWIGDDADRPSVKLLARALGARDVALGIGAVLAMNHDAPVRGWIEGGGFADAGDLAATLLHFRSLPRVTRWGLIALTSGAAVTARYLALAVD